MKTVTSSSRISRLDCAGLTVIEVFVIIATIAILAALLLPTPGNHRAQASRLNCISNLKQVGLAFRMWSNDNHEQFPFAVVGANGIPGTRQFVESGEVWRHFAILSNELNTPKVLVCATDTKRQRATHFEEFNSNASLSYFVGFDANEVYPQSILTGDRHLNVPVDPKTRLAKIRADTPVEWTSELHSSKELGAVSYGNIGLGDGSVMQANNSTLARQIQSALAQSNLASNTPSFLRLAIP